MPPPDPRGAVRFNGPCSAMGLLQCSCQWVEYLDRSTSRWNEDASVAKSHRSVSVGLHPPEYLPVRCQREDLSARDGKDALTIRTNGVNDGTLGGNSPLNSRCGCHGGTRPATLPTLPGGRGLRSDVGRRSGVCFCEDRQALRHRPPVSRAPERGQKDDDQPLHACDYPFAGQENTAVSWWASC